MNELLQKIDNIVKIIEDKFKSLRIFPTQIDIVNGISDISKRLGLFRNGELRFGNSIEPGFGFTGIRIGFPAFTYDASEWVMAVVIDDVIQFGVGLNGEIMPLGVKYADSPNLDAFSRLRTSNPVGLLDAQFTYDLQPLIFEQVVTGTGATIAHDSTNRMALMTFSSTPAGGTAYLQSYEWFRYQTGRSQLPIITFNMNGGVAKCIKFAELGDGTNAFGFRLNGTVIQFYVKSGTDNGNEVASQSSWNLDKLNGTGASGLTLDVTKEQILVIDYQALYVGRIRMGFDIGGQIIYCHEFLHANAVTKPYVQLASLPIRIGMTCSGTVSTTMWANCATVLCEGGMDDVGGYLFSAEGTVTASSGADTHLLSVRPKTTFNSISNRTRFELQDIQILVSGSSPVLWKLVIGQAISGTTTYNDVNASYSAFEYNTLGTISGSAGVVIAQGYVASSAQSKGQVTLRMASKYPISLSASGSVRAMGTLSLLVQGVGGTSATRASMNWKEIR